MLPLAPFLRLARHLQSVRARHQTDRILGTLPAHIRKDIGWPASDVPRLYRRRP